MKVTVADADLARCLASQDLLLQAYGAEKGKVLMRRLSELRALRCLGDLRSLPHVRNSENTKLGAGQITVSVQDGLNLVIRPNLLAPGATPNWVSVTEIMIVKITSNKRPLRTIKA